MAPAAGYVEQSGFNPFDIIAGGVTSLAPALLDEITGASAARKKAIQDRQNAYDYILRQLKQDRGRSNDTSGVFTRGRTLLDRTMKQRTEAIRQNQAAGGTTDEAVLAHTAQLGSQDSANTLALLDRSAEERRRLQDGINKVTLDKANINVAETDATIASNQAVGANLAAAVPYFLRPNKSNVVYF